MSLHADHPIFSLDTLGDRRVEPVCNGYVIGTFSRSLRLLDIDRIELLSSGISGRLPKSLLPRQLRRAEFSIRAKGGFLADDRAAAPAFFNSKLLSTGSR
jgi:hypothetical protein